MRTRSSSGRIPLTLSDLEFREVQELAYSSSGLALADTKRELVAARLETVARGLNFGSFHEYYLYVVQDRTGDGLIDFIDALTTNHTSFLREPSHFDFLRQRFIASPKNRAQPWRIWSAACSTGEEAYSIAMSLHAGQQEVLPGWSILATDISSRAIKTAQRGAYPVERSGDIPPSWQSEFLERGRDEWANWFRIRAELAHRIHFERRNLIHDFSEIGKFHAIFCRNVMIYFDKHSREDLIGRLSDRLLIGGFLFIGHSESLIGLSHSLESAGPAIYRKQ